MNLQAFVIFGGIPVAALATGVWAHGEAKQDAGRRRALLRRAAKLLVGGVIVAVGIWFVGPTNPESPAMLLTYAISFIGGGGMILFGTALGVGAASGRPEAK